MGSSGPLSARMDAYGSTSPGVALSPSRKAQGPKEPIEPSFSGCIMVTVCWCLALTTKVSASYSCAWLRPWPVAPWKCWGWMWLLPSCSPATTQITGLVQLTSKGITSMFLYTVLSEAPFFAEETASCLSLNPHEGLVLLHKTECEECKLAFA